MKICAKCKLEKMTDCYHKNKSKKDGLQPLCKTCRSAYIKQHYEANKKTYYARSVVQRKKRRKEIRRTVLEHKTEKCLDCKRQYHPCQMDFDHVRGTKRFNISMATRAPVTLEALKKEIDKCEVVCSNCHRLRTLKRECRQQSPSGLIIRS